MNSISDKATQTQTQTMEAAFEATAADRASLDEADLLPINLDAQVAATTVLQPEVLANIAELQEHAAMLPKIDFAQIAKVPVFARALFEAQTRFQAASTPVEIAPGLLEKGQEMRELLVLHATALSKSGLVDAKRLADVKGLFGYLNVASDLNLLLRIFRERWAEIGTKTAVSASQIEETAVIVDQLATVAAKRTTSNEGLETATDARARAFTLLVRAYEEARRVSTFVRWHEDDVDTFIPSLWARRGGRNESKKPVEPATEPTPIAPIPMPVQAGENGLPGGGPFVS